MSNASRKLMQVQATAAPPVDTGDPYWKYVSLLLDGDGTSGDDNETFTDSSTSNHSITENGSVVQGSFSPYGDNWSNSFDGDSDALTIPDSTDFDFGTGDFTMEAWIYPRSLNNTYDYNTIVSAHNPVLGSPATPDSWVFTVLNNQKLAIYGSGATTSSSNATVSLNEWSHVMITRSSGTIRFFINGTLDTNTPSVTGNFNCPSTGLAIGRQANPNVTHARYWDGWISNVRLVKGTALQTSSFTPSTSPLTAVTNTVLLACQSNRFIDNSSSSHTLTPTGTVAVTPFSPFKDSDARTLTADGGSAYFDGSTGFSNYLSKGSSSDFQFGTGDFTVESWVYITENSALGPNGYPDANIISYSNTASDGGWLFLILSGGGNTGDNGFGFQYWYASGSVDALYYNVSLGQNQWIHLAAVRNSNTLKLYLNGTEVASKTFTYDMTSGNTLGVGMRPWTPNNYKFPLDGMLTDTRVVKGTAVYTSDFTPPTSPLTAITNTKLLLNFQDAGIFDRAGINNLDTVGDARLGFAPIYGTGSLAFDGTGDYLGIKNTPALRFSSSSPFTIELWVNANVLSGDQHFFWAYDPSSPYTGWALAFGAYSQAATTLMWWDGTSWTNIKTGMEANRWYHIAVCSEGSASTGRFFVDGVQQGSAYTIPSTILNTTTNIRLGGQNNALYFNGYFDDVRITNGVARYTSDFTPPTEIDLSTDTHREYVTLFLDGDGTANGQNNTFTDSSTNDFTVTETGSVVQGVFSPYGDNWSNYFDGSGDYLTATGTAIGTGDFTLEAWIYTGSFSNYRTIFTNRGSSNSTSNFVLGVNSAAQVYLYSNGFLITSSSTLSANTWHHVALVRNGTGSGSTVLYIDGSSVGSADVSNNFSDTAYDVGGDTVDSYHWNGYISNFRVNIGTAIYTSAFTPSTEPLTAVSGTSFLSCQSNRFLDESTSNNTVTVNGNPKVTRFSPFESDKPYDITTDGGSGYFDGSSDYLLSTGESFGTGDFTVEAWLYPTEVGSSGKCWFDTRDTNNSGNGMVLFINTSGLLSCYSSGAIRLTSSTALKPNTWSHVAFVRNNGAIYWFIDGSLSNSTSYSSLIASPGGFKVGARNDTAANFIGYISNLRVNIGTAIYTSAFTPPTSPLTAVTNTELLLNFQDSAIPDLSGINNIDTVGNAKVAGTDPTKYGSNAMQFDGAGDYLELQANQEVFNLGTSDFTVECWFYANALSATTYSTLFGFHNGSSSEWGSYVRSNGVFIYGSANTLTGAGTVSTSTWHHYAATRSGSTVRVFLNGTQVATDTVSGSYTSSAIPFRVGIDGGINDYFNGYIDDLRITKGYARYTSNFTPPTAALKKF